MRTTVYVEFQNQCAQTITVTKTTNDVAQQEQLGPIGAGGSMVDAAQDGWSGNYRVKGSSQPSLAEFTINDQLFEISISSSENPDID